MACGLGLAPRSIRHTKTPAITSSAIKIMLPKAWAKAPPKPKCDSSAAIPNPAASPAIGPSQRLPAGCGCAGCCGAALGLAASRAGGDACRVTLPDCRPKLRPPPIRAASASGTNVAKAMTTSHAPSAARLIQCFELDLQLVMALCTLRNEE